jgi:hypothetical protein
MWELEGERNDLEKSARDRESRVREVRRPLEVSQVMRCT